MSVKDARNYFLSSRIRIKHSKLRDRQVNYESDTNNEVAAFFAKFKVQCPEEKKTL